MDRRQFLKESGRLSLAVSLLPRTIQERTTHKPNIVLILVDDLGWTDLACFGSRYYETPNIDRLCASGMKFTQGYAACAVCSPTRAAVMTGRHPARLGITDWIHPTHRLKAQALAEGETPGGHESWPDRKLATPINKLWLGHDEVTLAEALKAEGYATCHVGKWHLGYEPWWPDKQGFDANIGGNEYGHPPSYFDPYGNDSRPSIPTLPSRNPGEYLTDREASEAAAFIRRNKDQPFFLYMAHYAVHTPIQSKGDLRNKYAAKTKTNQTSPTYAGMVESVDQAVGTILSTLEELDLTDRTLIVFTSDNGGASHVSVDGGQATDNSPLRQGKGFPYEGGIRVPWIISWPGKIESGSNCAIPVCSQDLFPTLLGIAGAPLPRERILDGMDIAPLLRGQHSLPRTALFWHFPHYWWGGRLTPYSVIREGDWKLIRHYEGQRLELFNIRADIGEKTDLAARFPDRVRSLQKQLDLWLQDVGAELPKLNPDYRPEKNYFTP
ncbi:MAG: sulfatase [Candidatus Aminicenantaceae bacterium]